MAFSQRLIQRIWQRQGVWGHLGWLALTPLSLGFAPVVRSRNLLYDRGWLSVSQPGLRVISVGNLTVGGTGKTPLVLWLAQALQNRRYKVGILTQGYKGHNRGITVVGISGQSRTTPAEVGDEPIMLARAFAGVVIAGRDRKAAAQLAQERFGLDTVIVDDGFQYRRLRRDLDILLVHGGTGVGNGWLLPAGPLREPRAGAQRADMVIATKGKNQKHTHWLTRGRTRPLFTGTIKPTALVEVVHGQWQELPLGRLASQRVVALTGIADPVPFYQSLRDWEAQVAEVLEFPDHHIYTRTDWKVISLASQKFDLIVTTEKDLVKLEQFPFAAGKLVALRVRMEIEEEDAVLALIEQRLALAGNGRVPDASFTDQERGEHREDRS